MRYILAVFLLEVVINQRFVFNFWLYYYNCIWYNM